MSGLPLDPHFPPPAIPAIRITCKGKPPLPKESLAMAGNGGMWGDSYSAATPPGAGSSARSGPLKTVTPHLHVWRRSSPAPPGRREVTNA